MPDLPYLFDAALSFNNKQNPPRGQRFTSKPAGFVCRHSTENLKHGMEYQASRNQPDGVHTYQYVPLQNRTGREVPM